MNEFKRSFLRPPPPPPPITSRERGNFVITAARFLLLSDAGSVGGKTKRGASAGDEFSDTVSSPPLTFVITVEGVAVLVGVVDSTWDWLPPTYVESLPVSTSDWAANPAEVFTGFKLF